MIESIKVHRGLFYTFGKTEKKNGNWVHSYIMRFKNWLEEFKLPSTMPKTSAMPNPQLNPRPVTSANTASNIVKNTFARNKSFSSGIASLPTKSVGQQRRSVANLTAKALKAGGTDSNQTNPVDVQNNIKAMASAGDVK